MKYHTVCSCWDERKPETIERLVLECARWGERRAALIEGDTENANQLIGVTSSEAECTVLSLAFGGKSDTVQLED